MPSNSRKFNYISLAINTILILLCLDFQFTPKLFFDVKDTTFVRVGAVSDTSVKLVARVPKSLYPIEATQSSFNAPTDVITHEEVDDKADHDAAAISGSVLDSIIAAVDPNAHSHATTVPTNNEANSAKLVYRAARAAGAWHYGGSIIPSPDTDYVSTIELKDLRPSTEYEYALILPTSQKDKFITPNVDHPYHFKTSPDYKLSIHQTHFTFAASSCIKQNFPYAPGQDHLSIKGASELADRINPDKIEFLVRRKLLACFRFLPLRVTSLTFDHTLLPPHHFLTHRCSWVTSYTPTYLGKLDLQRDTTSYTDKTLLLKITSVSMRIFLPTISMMIMRSLT